MLSYESSQVVGLEGWFAGELVVEMRDCREVGYTHGGKSGLNEQFPVFLAYSSSILGLACPIKTCPNIIYISTMDVFSPLSDEDHIENPNFSSSSLNYPSNTIDNRVYDHINVDNTLYYNSNPNTLSVIDHQDSSSSNTLAYLNTIEQTPDLLEVTTDVNNSKSPQISADGTSMTQLTWIERELLYDDNSNIERMNDDTKVGFRIQTTREVLDDGYRWRKYGKKNIKCTPNPSEARNLQLDSSFR
nr:probable WRKY transcription factor 51 [Tanacetum cinerariifolium]